MRRLPPAPLGSRISDQHYYVRKLADRMSQEKRLTDAEIAAELWRCRCTGWPLHKVASMRRFATLPHYDEDQT